MKRIFNKGFSTVELMIAFALMSLVFGGVILADFSASYWAIAAETSNEGLYKAKTRLEELRAVVKKDFRLASSSPATKVLDTSCNSGSLCYFVQTIVSDLSPCSKYVQAQVDWQVQNYPTTTTSLFTNLTDTGEAINLGGDCPLIAPQGAWSSMVASTTFPSSVAGTPKSIDMLGGVMYMGTDASPYFRILAPAGAVAFTNSFALLDAVNAVDTARDIATGRTYAYLAMASTSRQLAVVDVTDMYKPVQVASIQLANVSGATSDGWRVAYYEQKVYITTRDSAGNELHILDASNPAAPVELASLDLSTSVYSFVVRGQYINGAIKRYMFAADSLDSGEVKIIDVTNAASPALATTLDLPDTGCSLVSNQPDGTSAFVSGNTLYVGREHSSVSCPSLPNVYAIDISNPLAPVITSSAVSNSSDGGIIGLRVSGDFVFLMTSTNANPGVGGLLDIEGDYVYAAKNITKNIQVWKVSNNNLTSFTRATPFVMPNTVHAIKSL